MTLHSRDCFKSILFFPIYSESCFIEIHPLIKAATRFLPALPKIWQHFLKRIKTSNKTAF